MQLPAEPADGCQVPAHVRNSQLGQFRAPTVWSAGQSPIRRILRVVSSVERVPPQAGESEGVQKGPGLEILTTVPVDSAGDYLLIQRTASVDHDRVAFIARRVSFYLQVHEPDLPGC